MHGLNVSQTTSTIDPNNVRDTTNTDGTAEDITLTVRNISISLIAVWLIIVTVMTAVSMYRRKKRAEAAAAARLEGRSDDDIPADAWKYFLPPPSYADCIVDPPSYEEAMKYIKEGNVVVHI